MAPTGTATPYPASSPATSAPLTSRRAGADRPAGSHAVDAPLPPGRRWACGAGRWRSCPDSAPPLRRPATEFATGPIAEPIAGY